MHVRVALFNSMHGNKVKVFMQYNVMSIYCLLNLPDKEEEMFCSTLIKNRESWQSYTSWLKHHYICVAIA